ncbi:MAG: sodium:calcium antiporter [Geobacteraceae bacterium]|nr:sodium:calcium antiporter [Geobacteraceae bacterium]
MWMAITAVLLGLILLLWSADRFVEGAAAAARHFGMPALLIGMVVVGFGTSAPEMVVSALASIQGNPGIALGNAYGSNAVVLLLVFVAVMGWTIVQGMRSPGDALGIEIEGELTQRSMPLGRALLWLLVGLVMLVVSSRLLVWGAVDIARSFGVSDLIIGLTIIAIGTSLPELASSIIAARKGEHDIALGNVLGSNMFNTLTVVGIAGVIHPMSPGPEVLERDMLVMTLLTISLFLLGYGFGKKRGGRINRIEGTLLLLVYVGYNAYLISTLF